MSNSEEMKQNWTIPKNFEICFCVIFDHYCQKITSYGETGH